MFVSFFVFCLPLLIPEFPRKAAPTIGAHGAGGEFAQRGAARVAGKDQPRIAVLAVLHNPVAAGDVGVGCEAGATARRQQRTNARQATAREPYPPIKKKKGGEKEKKREKWKKEKRNPKQIK